ncbi:hypothetical protein ACFOEE_06220 [Pseudoalteromonas fenneropenaei]|uniref:Uncharacterized protein n=1 Tax=Pseudoalteromonas fenneropenaei TaxID=1737459 RepID=A0ABV7CHG6_9GAMM
MKNQILKGVGYSLLSPILVGTVLGIYYAVTLPNGSSATFFSLLISAIANAHIVGLAIGVAVLPAYLWLYKRGKVSYNLLATVGLLAGAVFSYIFAAAGGVGFIVNAVMSGLAAALFLYGLRRNAERLV